MDLDRCAFPRPKHASHHCQAQTCYSCFRGSQKVQLFLFCVYLLYALQSSNKLSCFNDHDLAE